MAGEVVRNDQSLIKVLPAAFGVDTLAAAIDLVKTLGLTDFADNGILQAIDGFSAAKLKSGKYVIVWNNIPISLQTYDHISPLYKLGLFLIKSSGKYMFLKPNGDPVDGQEYTEIDSLKDARNDALRHLYVGYQDKQAYLIDDGGKKISEHSYDNISVNDDKFVIGSGTGDHEGKECLILSPSNITDRFDEIEFFNEDLFVAIGKKIEKGNPQLTFINDQGEATSKGSLHDYVYLRDYQISYNKMLVQADDGWTILDTIKGKFIKKSMFFDRIDGQNPERRASDYSDQPEKERWRSIILSSSQGRRPAAADFSFIGELYVSEDTDWHRDAEPPFRLFQNAQGKWIFTEPHGELLCVPKNIVKLQWICPYYESSSPYRPYHIKGTLDNGNYIYISAEYFSGFNDWNKKQYDALTIRKQRGENTYIIEGHVGGSVEEIDTIQDVDDPIDTKLWK